MSDGPGSVISSLLPLLSELNDLKRTRTSGSPESLAGLAFVRSWASLCSGEGPESVALDETSRAVCAARLGGVDAGVLTRGGLTTGETEEVLRRSFDAVLGPDPGTVSDELRLLLRDRIGKGGGRRETTGPPGFVESLARQPRAGCTRPGSPRLVLEPPESHADHCFTVACYGVLLSDRFDADPARVFVAGLAHHLHNAVMPDSGFTGEMLLGGHLEGVVAKLTADALDELHPGLRAFVSEALEPLGRADGPEARAFNAADVLDRVLQMRHYAREAGFTLDQALDEMDLVHEGPVKSFHETVLSEAGLS